MQELQDVIDLLNLEQSLHNDAPPLDEEYSPKDDHLLIPTFHDKMMQTAAALTYAEILTLLGIGAAYTLPTEYQKPIGSFLHGMSCGIGKNLIMSIFAEDFKSSDLTNRAETFLLKYFEPKTASYIAKEYSITLLSIVGAGLNDTRSMINKEIIGDTLVGGTKLADIIDLNPPDPDDYQYRILELVIGRITKDVVFKALYSADVPILNVIGKAANDSVFKASQSDDILTLNERTFVPIVIGDFAKLFVKDIWKTYYIPHKTINKVFTFQKIAYNLGCSLTKPFASWLFRDYIKPYVSGKLNSEKSREASYLGSWGKFIESTLSTTTSSIFFTTMAKWLRPKE